MNFFKKFNNLKNKPRFKSNFPKVLAIAAFAILFLIGGTSYAYLNYTESGILTNTVSAGTLSLALNNEGSAIVLNRAVPQTDEDALANNQEYTFSVKNNGSIFTHYEITLSSICNTSTSYIVGGSTITPDLCMPAQYVKVGIKKGTGDYMVTKFTNNSVAIDVGSLFATNVSDTYSIKLWLDVNTPNTYSAITSENADRDVLFVANLSITGEQIDNKTEEIDLDIGKSEVKTLNYVYSGSDIPTCTVDTDNPNVTCTIDTNEGTFTLNGVTGGATTVAVSTSNEILETVNLTVYEAPSTPTITASDDIASDTWHTADTTLTYGGSSITNGPGEVVYYSGPTFETMTSTATSTTALTNTAGDVYLVKACNSAYPKMCSEEVEYAMKIDKTSPTITWNRTSTSNVTISCTDSVSGVALLQLWWRKPGDAYQSNYTNYRYEYGWVTPVGSMYTKNYVYFKTGTVGTHYIYARCKDNAGNITNANRSYTVSSSSSGTTTSSQTSATITGTCTCVAVRIPAYDLYRTTSYSCASNGLKSTSACSFFCINRSTSSYRVRYTNSTCAAS